MGKFSKSVVLAVLCVLIAWGVSRAMASKYSQKRQEILAACKAERDKLGPAEQKALQSKCATPEISLVSAPTLMPGQTANVTITGKFPAGTRFLFESDCIDVVTESVAPNTYRATIKVSLECGPQHVSASAFTPVCCKSAWKESALKIGGNFAWEMSAANGWRIKGTAIPPDPAVRQTEDLSYMLEFYRGNETAPFTKRRATLTGSVTTPPEYRFSISDQDEAESNPMVEMQKIVAQFSNPNLTDAERDKIMKKMEELTATVTKEASKMSDPNYIKQLQAKQDQFGCSSINVTSQNGTLDGNLRCSQKVGSSIKITGSMKFLGK
jgi:hypothetical protein